MRISDWSSDVCSSDLRDLACGGRSYFHLATRDLNEIVDSLSQPGTLDDPAGFLYVVNGLAQYVPLEELAAIRFDLWVDSETGATIAVPAKIGRAHVSTPVTNAHLVCRLLLEKKKNI